MGLDLVTGFKGTAHITATDIGAFNAGVVGTGEYVMPTGKQFEAQVISNNQIRIYDGDILMQGRHITLKKDTYEDVVIANGLQGMNRNDLIAVRYTKYSTTVVETAILVVIQGVSTDGTASDPSYTTGDILSGECLLHEMPLYRVPLSGLNVGKLVPLFTVSSSLLSFAEMTTQIETNTKSIEQLETEKVDSADLTDTVPYNLIPFPYYSMSGTTAGIQYATDEEGVINANGTSTAQVTST